MGIFNFYSYIQAELEILGGVMLPALCEGIVVHPWKYSHDSLFILVLFPRTIINICTIAENTDTIHTILTMQANTIHYLYSR